MIWECPKIGDTGVHICRRPYDRPNASVQLEIEFCLGDSGRVNEEDFTIVAGVNVTFSDGGEYILAQLHNTGLVQGWCVNCLVLLCDLRIQNTHDQRTTTATGRVGNSLKASNCIIVIHRTLPFIINTT